MTAKAERRPASGKRTKTAAPKPKARRPTARLPQAARRAQIIDKAFDYFSEHGLTGQTRGLAEACGVSQRLLYSVFPNKAALLDAVYEAEIAGPFKVDWFVLLKDRSKTVEQRLTEFYLEYYEVILTRRWLRLFLYASLSEVRMAPAYVGQIVTNLLEIMVDEAAHEAALSSPAEPALKHETGWTLHGAVSHLAIRRHIYGDANPCEPQSVIAMHVKFFLAGLKEILPAEDNTTPGSEPVRASARSAA
jgi:AcrR family transcriptional regulator